MQLGHNIPSLKDQQSSEQQKTEPGANDGRVSDSDKTQRQQEQWNQTEEAGQNVVDNILLHGNFLKAHNELERDLNEQADRRQGKIERPSMSAGKPVPEDTDRGQYDQLPYSVFQQVIAFKKTDRKGHPHAEGASGHKDRPVQTRRKDNIHHDGQDDRGDAGKGKPLKECQSQIFGRLLFRIPVLHNLAFDSEAFQNAEKIPLNIFLLECG